MQRRLRLVSEVDGPGGNSQGTSASSRCDQQIFDDRRHLVALLRYETDEFYDFVPVEGVKSVAQLVRQSHDRSEWRAKFMAHGGDELVA